MAKRKKSVLLICLILISVITINGLFLERKDISIANEKPLFSLTKQEIIEKANNKMRSSFLENKGQVKNQEILFYGSLPIGKIGFGESKVMLWMNGLTDFVTLSFIGANSCFPVGVNELESKSNYFLGDRGTFTSVRNFDAIIYYNLWSGIDLYYKATPKGTKYEFRVALGGNPEEIIIYCEGQDKLNIGKDSLSIMKNNGRYIDEGLKVIQDGSIINAKFIAKGSNTFGFQIDNYDSCKPLVIDPLLYSTFVGGGSYDIGQSVTLDSDGNAYVTGGTWSSFDFPTTHGSYNRTQGGESDCFVFKLSADGSSLRYSTFIGGNNYDTGTSITLDNERNAYVTGFTSSDNFPTTEYAYNGTLSGESDCFVLKLSTNSSTLFYSTFVGGSESEIAKSIAINNLGNAYVTGYTTSDNFPTNEEAYNRTYCGSSQNDCFVFKLSTGGFSLEFSTFVGGIGHDLGNSIVIDSSGNAYVTGSTGSNNFPTTINAYDRVYNGVDCFVFKLASNGSTLLYSTFVGGSAADNGFSIALDNDCNAFVTGHTQSNNFPTTPNAFDRIFNGNDDCFIFKLASNGSTLLYSTLFGGNLDESGYSIVIDDERNAYVTGRTYSSDFPTIDDVYDESYNGKADCFIFKLAANGSTLLYSTFIGRSEDEYGFSIAISTEGNAYVTGFTESSNFPTTDGAFDETYNGYGESDCFVIKLFAEVENPSTPTPTPTPTNEGVLIGGLVSSSLVILMVTTMIYLSERRKKYLK